MGVSVIQRNKPPAQQNLPANPNEGYVDSSGALIQDPHATPPQKFQVINPQGGMDPFITPTASPSSAPQQQSYFEKINSAYDTYQKIMNHPLTRGMAKLTQDASFRENAMKVISHPNRMSVLYTELIWFLVFLIIRANIMSRMEGFIKRLITNLFLLLGFWIGSTLVPVIIFGKPYIEVYKSIFRAYFGN
jgi:hypothetical protein